MSIPVRGDGLKAVKNARRVEVFWASVAATPYWRYGGIMNPLLERITIEPGKAGGRPCIRGLRVRVQDVLEMLANGMTPAEIVEDYPYLEPDDVRAVLAYAAAAVGDTAVVAA